MKKYRFIFPLFIFPSIILLFTGCPNGGPEDLPERPTITIHTAVLDGASFKLEWIDNTDGGSEVFYIYSGNTAIDSTFPPDLDCTIDENDRASSVGVTAWIGDEESPEATLDLSLTVTSSLAVWSTADPDPDHPSFVKFANGTAVAVPESIAINEATFYINNDFQFESIQYWPYVNNANDDPAFADASSPFDFAPGTGNYERPWSFAGGGKYYIWIDRSPMASMGVEDDFARIEVISIDGNKVTLTISYQNENGLRWLVD